MFVFLPSSFFPKAVAALEQLAQKKSSYQIQGNFREIYMH
jgi:hypothetical protein